ncbi:MAG: radical SAM protein [Pyrinomonadaceae bacterium]
MGNKVKSLVEDAASFTKLLRSYKGVPKLETLILFVTSRCNAACETCFYHEELNTPGDMSFDQIARMSATMPAICDLWLSGGEPTLRKDLVEIVSIFANNNQIRRVIIPTNGLIAARCVSVVERILSENESVEELYVNVALDGIGKTHDRIRGVPGNWEKTLGTIAKLQPLKNKFGDRLRLNVNSVVCADNYAEMESLGELLWKEQSLDGHYFNIIRGETKAGDGIKRVPSDALTGIYRYAAALTERYAGRMFASDAVAKRFVKKVAYVGTILTHYRHQHENAEKPTPWSFPCTAGETIAVVDYNGDVRACELLDKFASLSEFEYDFSALWNDSARTDELEKIDGGNSCWCTHVCFIHSSLQHSGSGLLGDVSRNYLRRKSWK